MRKQSLTLILSLPLVAVVFVVNGAVPGVLMPTFGQALWALGFAQSFANPLFPTIFAHNVGAPGPATIAFGLPAVYTMALFLKAGLASADAYSAAFALWLAVAFWGAFRLCRKLRAPRIASLLWTTVWLTVPVIWEHQSYSMLALGMALLPFYICSAWELVWNDDEPWRDYGFFLVAAIISAFMDGYTFMMFASAVAGFFVISIITSPERRWRSGLLRLAGICGGFVLAAILYMLYVGTPHFDNAGIDFFRGWGANLEFLAVPTTGLLYLPDLLGLSEPRSVTQYFGDSSVYTTTFSTVFVLVAAYAVFTDKSDRRWTLALAIIAVASFYLSLGPSFKFHVMKPPGVGPTMPESYAPIPTGTAPLFEHLPGLKDMRAVYRWVALGVCACWMLFAMSLAGRRGTRGWTLSLIAIVFLFGLPHLAKITSYSDAYSDLKRVDKLAERNRPYFHHDELVAFLPWNNDFLITYVAPKMDIKTYNVGGDKNLAIATNGWPLSLQRFPHSKGDGTLTGHFAAKVAAVLEDEDADAVALSYRDNLAPAQGWPVPKVNFDALQPVIQKLRANPRLSIAETPDYAIARLKPGLTGRGDAAAFPLHLDVGKPFKISKASVDDYDSFAGYGWYGFEPTGVWSRGEKSRLYLSLGPNPGPLQLKVHFHGFFPKKNSRSDVQFSVNGKMEYAKTIVSGREKVAVLRIPESVAASGAPVDLELSVSPARSPADFGSKDTRQIGIFLESIELVQ